LGEWRRLEEMAIQRIEGIVSGEVMFLAPREELIMSRLKEIGHQ
jgi:hypothetical protein